MKLVADDAATGYLTMVALATAFSMRHDWKSPIKEGWEGYRAIAFQSPEERVQSFWQNHKGMMVRWLNFMHTGDQCREGIDGLKELASIIGEDWTEFELQSKLAIKTPKSLL